MSLPPTADVIVLSSTSTVPLHERFTIMLKSRPDLVAVEANLQQKETSFRNRKLVLQMEDRPSVLVALQHKLEAPSGKKRCAGQAGPAHEGHIVEGCRQTVFYEGTVRHIQRRLSLQEGQGGAFKPGFNFRSLGPRRGWNSLARKKLRSALRMQGGLVTSSGQLVTHRAWYQTGRGRRGVGLGLDQAGTMGHSGFDTNVGFRDWGGFNNRGGFNTRGSYGTRGGSLMRGSFRAGVAFGARGRGTFRGSLVITKEQLDNELDEYMSMSKSNLDVQLDEYMSMASADYI